jgi:hypothetical protein
MNKITVLKVNDECLSRSKFEIWKNGFFYLGNLTASAKNNFINKLDKTSTTIVNKTLNVIDDYTIDYKV